MSISAKGFIPFQGNSAEALNAVVYSFVRLCSLNNVFNKDRHPFRLKAIEMGGPLCFFVRFTNERDEGDFRMLQIGVYEDMTSLQPVGGKVSFSIGSHGDAPFIVQSALLAGMKAINAEDGYFQEVDYTSEYTRLNRIDLELGTGRAEFPPAAAIG